MNLEWKAALRKTSSNAVAWRWVSDEQATPLSCSERRRPESCKLQMQ
jgi:hypothetical protein